MAGILYQNLWVWLENNVFSAQTTEKGHFFLKLWLKFQP